MRLLRSAQTAPTPDQGSDELAVSGLGEPVELRRHPSARRLTLRVSRTKRAVVLTMPLRCSRSEADKFLHRHLDWVQTCLSELPSRVPFEHGAIVPLRGAPHQLYFTGVSRSASVVEARRPDMIDTSENATTTGDTPVQLDVSGLLQHAPRRFRDWMFDQARVDLGKRVQYHTKNLSLHARRITIRDQSTRWGSCSSTGRLSFSWRLIMAPGFVLDYVAAHEVAHLAEMNHGPRFWELVELTMPRMIEAKEWLSTQGMDLHRYDS